MLLPVLWDFNKLMNPPKIQMENISVSFKGQSVFRDFSMHFPSGSKTLMTGPSGSGKSTILRLILGFHAPDRGQIRIDGQEVNDTTIWKLRRHTAYVGQELNIDTGKVRPFFQNIFQIKSNSHLVYDEEAIRGLLIRFRLKPDTLDKSWSELSGGEKQRIAITAALMQKRMVFLLDEVSASLDRELKREVAAYFMGNPDWTVIVVSHYSVWQEFDDVRHIELGRACDA